MTRPGRFPYEVIGNMRDVLDRIMRAEPARPSTVCRQINDEVETIVLKCLQKERERRYQTAGELARDVRHYLAAGVVLLQAGSSIALSVMYRNQVLARRVAVAEREKAEKIAGFMTDMLKGVGPSQALGRDTTMLREMMDGAAKRIKNGEMKDAPEAELQLRLTIGATYRELAVFAAAEQILGPALFPRS